MSFDRKPTAPRVVRAPLPRSNPNALRSNALPHQGVVASSHCSLQQPPQKLLSDRTDSAPSGSVAASSTTSKSRVSTCAGELEYNAMLMSLTGLRRRIVHAAKENASLEQTIFDLQAAYALKLAAEKETIQRSRDSLDQLVAKEREKIQSHRDELTVVEAAYSTQQERNDVAEAQLHEAEKKLSQFREDASSAKRQREESMAECANLDAERKRCIHRMSALEAQRRRHEENLDALKEQTAREVALEVEAKKELADRLSVVHDLDAKIKALQSKR